MTVTAAAAANDNISKKMCFTVRLIIILWICVRAYDAAASVYVYEILNNIIL